jgi:hypothetical protein
LYERLQEYHGRIAEYQKEIECCERAIEMLENGKDIETIQNCEEVEIPF